MFEYECLKRNDLSFAIKRNNISDNIITVFFHSARSLTKRIDDIISDDKLINNDIMAFTETQLKLPDSTCRII